LLQAAPGKFYAKPFGHGNAAQANVRQTPSAPEELFKILLIEALSK